MCGKRVFRMSARILVPANDMNPVAIADSGASHVILPTSALPEKKTGKNVTLRLAAGQVRAVEPSEGDLRRSCHCTFMSFRKSCPKTGTYGHLDPAEFNFDLFEFVWNSTWIDAVPSKG